MITFTQVNANCIGRCVQGHKTDCEFRILTSGKCSIFHSSHFHPASSSTACMPTPSYSLFLLGSKLWNPARKEGWVASSKVKRYKNAMYSPKKSTPYSEDGRGYLYPYICYMIPEMTLSTWNIPRILWLFGHFQGLECTILPTTSQSSFSFVSEGDLRPQTLCFSFRNLWERSPCLRRLSVAILHYREPRFLRVSTCP